MKQEEDKQICFKKNKEMRESMSNERLPLSVGEGVLGADSAKKREKRSRTIG